MPYITLALGSTAFFAPPPLFPGLVSIVRRAAHRLRSASSLKARAILPQTAAPHAATRAHRWTPERRRIMQSTEVIEVIVPEPPMGCSLALSDRGALCTVEAVQPASRAAGAGVREGDVLLTANGQAPPIESESERALVDFFRQLRYPLRLAFARRAKDARFGDAARRAGAAAAEAPCGRGGRRAAALRGCPLITQKCAAAGARNDEAVHAFRAGLRGKRHGGAARRSSSRRRGGRLFQSPSWTRRRARRPDPSDDARVALRGLARL